MLKPEVVSMKPEKKSRGFKKLVKNQKYTIKRESISTLQIGKNTVFLKSCTKTKSPCNTVIWFSKKRHFRYKHLFCFQNGCHGYIIFFEKHTFGNHFDRKCEYLVFFVSGFKRKLAKCEKTHFAKSPLIYSRISIT